MQSLTGAEEKGGGQSPANHASEFNKHLFIKEEQMRQLLTIEPTTTLFPLSHVLCFVFVL